jgi:hypothetical protein
MLQAYIKQKNSESYDMCMDWLKEAKDDLRGWVDPVPELRDELPGNTIAWDTQDDGSDFLQTFGERYLFHANDH